MKQTANDKSPGNCWHVARRPHDHGATERWPSESVRFYGPCNGIMRRPCGLLTTIARVYDYFLAKMTILNPALSSRSPCSARTGIVRCHCDVSTGLRFFQIYHCAELNKIVEATMPVNPYDDHKVSLLRPHWNGDLDIVRASYTRRKANVTEPLAPFWIFSHPLNVFHTCLVFSFLFDRFRIFHTQNPYY